MAEREAQEQSMMNDERFQTVDPNSFIKKKKPKVDKLSESDNKRSNKKESHKSIKTLTRHENSKTKNTFKFNPTKRK